MPVSYTHLDVYKRQVFNLVFCRQEWGPLGQPVGTPMDSLTAALKSNIIPNQEYLLQGSVLDSAVEVLLHRLRGLCDNVDSGPETFHDLEMCFSIRKENTLYIC